MNGLLLVNLGTPDAPTSGAVARYLREFLSDPRVIDINAVGRFLLVNAIIAPFRSPKSARAYREVWTDRGSPLLFHGQDLAAAVQELLGDTWAVELAMRYGQPNLSGALDRLAARGADRVVVLPLYPQYASSSTGSTRERVFELAGERTVVPALAMVEDFYDDPGFLDAVTTVTRAHFDPFDADHVLFSFHGLPERQVKACDPTGAHCLASDACCDAIVDVNRACYRAQSFATARALAARLGLADGGWTVAFQSRLGRTPWIRPYTDEVLVELAKAGTRRLAVLCPSFVADCLETLEEIGIRARESFLEAGGEELLAVPCVNAAAPWAAAVADIARRAGGTTRELAATRP